MSARAARRSNLRHVVLVGPMGSGKTTVGAALAERLGCPLSDSDAWIAHRTGLTARDYRDRHGTETLHELEAEHLLGAIDVAGTTVICAAASTIEDDRCATALAGPGIAVVWLRPSMSSLIERFDHDRHRPLHGPDVPTMFAEQAVRRDPLFAGLSTIVVDADARPIDIVERIAGRLGFSLAESRHADSTRQ